MKPKELIKKSTQWVLDKIATHWLEVILFGVPSVSLTFSNARNFLVTQINLALRTPPIEWQSTTIAIGLLVIVCWSVIVSYFTFKFLRKRKAKFIFTDVNGFSWRSNQYGNTEYIPYCPKCHVRLTDLTSYYLCGKCESKYAHKGYTFNQKSGETAHNIVSAELAGHSK